MSLEYIINNPISVIGGRIAIIIFRGDMQDKLATNFTKANSLNLFDLNPPLDIGALQIIDSLIGNE